MKSVNWKDLGIILLCGAFGGVFAWFAEATAAGEFGKAWAREVVLGLIGGAVASWAAVYLISNSDMSQFARCMIFAVIAGMSWRPVIEGAKEIVLDASARKEVTVATTLLEDTLGSSETNLSATNAREITRRSADVMRKLPSVDDPDRQAEGSKSVKAAVRLLARNPEQSTDELVNIAKAAESSGNSDIKFEVKNVLDGISHNPLVTEAVRKKALAALAVLRDMN